ncbi:T-box transcription factor TBX6-like [Diorhabda sublineata]|uniref:T-box transcription factor TBX6-like n=1 Tax=Diorhabda sublineata TaxID=1163346 RepID=UPI0024E1869D|nr:T-box transcription factor TBX6-like [Diorhabda sublineata]
MVKYLSTMLHSQVNRHYNMHYEDTVSNYNVTLKNKDLWKTFHAEGTEMIITKSGRRMFPSIDIKVDGLCPDTKYHILLEMEGVSGTRFKYSTSGGWFPTGSEEAHGQQRFYSHPDSPAKGSYWMSQTIKFSRLKLTNSVSPPAGQILLASMHKYQPKIWIIRENELTDVIWSRKSTVVFPETQFIAVTAYQNENITKLKIDYNPFAKGFRETGQAKCKRRKSSEKKDSIENELIVVDDSPSENERLSPASSHSLSSNNSQQFENNSVTRNSDNSNYFLPTSTHSPTDLTSSFGPVLPSYRSRFTDFYYGSSPYYMGWNPSLNQTNIPSSIDLSLHNNYFPSQELPKPVKLTDFSIRAIIGCE